MVLHGDIGFWIERIHPYGEVVRKHQERDIVEEGGEVQIVRFAWGQADRLSDQQRDVAVRQPWSVCQGSARSVSLPI